MNTTTTYDSSLASAHGNDREVTLRAVYARRRPSRPLGYVVKVDYLDRPELNFVQAFDSKLAANRCFKTWKTLCDPKN